MELTLLRLFFGMKPWGRHGLSFPPNGGFAVISSSEHSSALPRQCRAQTSGMGQSTRQTVKEEEKNPSKITPTSNWHPRGRCSCAAPEISPATVICPPRLIMMELLECLARDAGLFLHLNGLSIPAKNETYTSPNHTTSKQLRSRLSGSFFSYIYILFLLRFDPKL